MSPFCKLLLHADERLFPPNYSLHGLIRFIILACSILFYGHFCFAWWMPINERLMNLTVGMYICIHIHIYISSILRVLCARYADECNSFLISLVAVINM